MLYNASKVYVTQWQPFALPTNGMANPDNWRQWAQVRPNSGDDHQQHDGGDDQQCDGDDDQQHDGGGHHLQLHRQHYRHHINYEHASCCR